MKKPNFKNVHWNRYNWIAIFGTTVVQAIGAWVTNIIFGQPQPIISLSALVGILWVGYFLDKSDAFESKNKENKPCPLI